MLTGKAKEDFRVWLGEPVAFQNFDNIPELVKHSYLIKWFDHVGIFIIPDYNDVNHKFNYNLYFNPQQDDIYVRPIYNSREEALNAGIEKANEIYNQT
ncbi:hypothetical protein [Chryseobacterium culicis]|uniref:hypothetical protein n=1 Tax=Chryseobacterium culicis TaxID=680127 RepID=UPI001876ECB8|nr:hypothetical protein [Chryseobacterium culicis]MBE4949923.1 hypothetical protein [Chryseobacterium culicis]